MSEFGPRTGMKVVWDILHKVLKLSRQPDMQAKTENRLPTPRTLEIEWQST